jgi:hypothetical protein
MSREHLKYELCGDYVPPVYLPSIYLKSTYSFSQLNLDVLFLASSMIAPSTADFEPEHTFSTEIKMSDTGVLAARVWHMNEVNVFEDNVIPVFADESRYKKELKIRAILSKYFRGYSSAKHCVYCRDNDKIFDFLNFGVRELEKHSKINIQENIKIIESGITQATFDISDDMVVVSIHPEIDIEGL